MVPAGMVPAGMMAHGGAPTRTTHGAGPQMKGRQALAEAALTVVALVGARAVAVVATARQRRRRRPKRRPNLGTMAKSSTAGQDERSGELPLLEENRELRITQQRVELRMEAGQSRTLRDEAQTLRSEYVEARSEEAALKTVLKLQQSKRLLPTADARAPIGIQLRPGVPAARAA